jgi:hypothetical protein
LALRLTLVQSNNAILIGSLDSTSARAAGGVTASPADTVATSTADAIFIVVLSLRRGAKAISASTPSLRRPDMGSQRRAQQQAVVARSRLPVCDLPHRRRSVALTFSRTHQGESKWRPTTGKKNGPVSNTSLPPGRSCSPSWQRFSSPIFWHGEKPAPDGANDDSAPKFREIAVPISPSPR